MTDNVVVLGAGLAGLSFAYHYGDSAKVFEKESEPGGLVRTVSIGPYKFDLAPHLLHLRSAEVEDLILNKLDLTVCEHERRAKIFVGGAVIPYPFELNLHGVSESIRYDCLDGLSEISASDRDSEAVLRAGSYGDYVMKAFGPGIANHYLLPYNRKIWDTDPFEMTCEWMRFLPTAEVGQIRRNAIQNNSESFGYNTTFLYPTEHGIQELPEAFAKHISRIDYGEEVVAIDSGLKKISFASGREESYDTLVSTIPLNDLAKRTGIDEFIQLASGLSYTSVYVVNVCIKGTVPKDTHWMYFPDPNLSFYRISFPKAYFGLSAPAGEHIVSVEVGSRQHDLDFSALEKAVVDELRQLEIFEIDEITAVHTECLANAYVIYDSARTERVTELKRLLRNKDIVSIGRYGNWEYGAMEDAIVQGRDAALMIKGSQ